MFKSNRRGTTEDGINEEDWPEEEIVDTGAIVPGPPPASVVKWDLASFQKPPKQQDGDGSAYGATSRTSGTVASSLTADQRSSSSGGSGNVWTRLLGKDTNWDKLGDGFDDQGGEEGEGCQRATKTCTLTMWYELCHFAHTVWSNPHILLLSLATFGVLCGVGMAAVNSERDAYVEKQKGVATFVAMETAQWFSDEFRRAMLPLYSIQQGVIHSGFFDDLPALIGPYPELVVPESLDTPFTKRNVTGICDDPDMIAKWRDIVFPVNSENDLDGVVVGYRLFPANVACLTEPHRQESTQHFDAEAFPQGDALLASDNVFGLDAGQTAFPLWQMITTDLFINKKFNIFGPFAMPPMTELICGHLPIWTRPDVKEPSSVERGRGLQTELSLDIDGAMATATNGSAVGGRPPDVLNVHGTDVVGAWGFVVNFLDWTKLKDRSDIYKRFAGCNLEFQLSRVGGATVEGIDLAVLAESPNYSLLVEANTIVTTTESLHGTWENRVGSIDGWDAPWYNTAVVCVVLGSFFLGLLTASTLVERQLHCNLLYKMMPKRAIAKLRRGQTVLEKFNLVTIFFSDIVGFTSMAGAMRPIQVMQMLNELYTELDKLVKKHQVYKVETIGDAYMVVGGAPDAVPAPLAAERVANFAIDAINFVKTFRTKEGDQVFIRVGLASGPTVAGVVGQAMPRYCFFGDTVNFASRMESTSKKMRIQCAEITYRLLQDSPNFKFHLTKRIEGDVVGVEVKGKGHQITYWIDKAAVRRVTLDRVSPALPPDSEAQAAAVNNNATSKFAGSEEYPQENFTSGEIYAAMTFQDWAKLGHAESGLVAATDERKKINVRAAALLEYHLDRVIKKRDPNSGISLSAKIQLSKFVVAVSQSYDGAKFHSYSHAIHVMTSMNALLPFALTEEPLNSFLLVFSALLHDAGHTGMSNKMLRESANSLCEKFPKEDVPLAERNSIDIGLKILFRPEYQSLREAIVPDELDKIEFGKTLFQSILITDIATPENVNHGIRRFEVSKDMSILVSDDLCPLAPYLSDILDGLELAEDVKGRHPDKFLVTRNGIKDCARNEHLMLLSDIAHLLQGWENFVKWIFRLYKELHDCYEKGLCVHPRLGWYQGQLDFFDKYIIPLSKRSKCFLREDFSNTLIKYALTNRSIWMTHGILATEIMSSAVDNDEKEIDVLPSLYELPTSNPNPEANLSSGSSKDDADDKGSDGGGSFDAFLTYLSD